MQIELIDDDNYLQADQKQLMIDILAFAGQELGLGQQAEVDVTIVDNPTIHELNRTYRQIDAPTDVLSFALTEAEDGGALEHALDLPVHLGDIIISFERAQEQAQAYGHSLERELAFLAVHGFLHLNGYDHQTPDEEAEMFRLQEEVLAAYGLTR